MAAEFKTTKLDYLIEHELGQLAVKEEAYPIKVRYEGWFFYCDVKVSCVVPDGETWYIGFIQSCDAMYLRHTYESGNYTQWEFPTPISDSTTQTFPYYSHGTPVQSGRRTQNANGIAQIDGPKLKSDHHEVEISMNDNLNSNVQWWDPVPDGHTNYNVQYAHELAKIERKQRFSTFVVASQYALTRSDIAHQILARVEWEMHFIIDFDCTKDLGQRSTKTMGDGHRIISFRRNGNGLSLPPACFVNTNANAAQKLVGYSSDGTRKKSRIPW